MSLFPNFAHFNSGNYKSCFGYLDHQSAGFLICKLMLLILFYQEYFSRFSYALNP